MNHQRWVLSTFNYFPNIYLSKHYSQSFLLSLRLKVLNKFSAKWHFLQLKKGKSMLISVSRILYFCGPWKQWTSWITYWFCFSWIMKLCGLIRLGEASAVTSSYPHAKWLHSRRHFLPNSSQSDYSQHFSKQLRAHELWKIENKALSGVRGNPKYCRSRIRLATGERTTGPTSRPWPLRAAAIVCSPFCDPSFPASLIWRLEARF